MDTQSSHSPTGKTVVNVSKPERVIAALAGSLLLYRTIRKHKANSLLLLGGSYLLYRAVTGHCPVYSMREQRADGPHNINVRTSVVVNRPRGEVYAYWRKLENLPLFMKHLSMVRENDDRTSSWMVRMPGGLSSLHWDAEIVKDEDGTELSWKSLPGGSIDNAGKINFTDTPGKATRIDAMITYRAPLGVVGEGLSRLLNPAFRRKVTEDIESFKFFMENNPSLSERV
jgi:uncharacterized membrane protein